MKKRILFVYLSLSLAIASQAQFSDLISLGGGKGAIPYGNIIVSGNVLYGMTYEGGLNYGCIFKLNKDGTGYKTLYNFTPPNTYPYGSLVLLGKKLYGTVTGIGYSGYGSIFSIDTNGNNYKDLMDFNSTDGHHPCGALISSKNKLYGITGTGGTLNGGVIFKIDTNGSGYTVLFNFIPSAGGNPVGSLVLSSNSRLYGMTSDGGNHYDGTIFSIDTNGNGFKKLLDFDSANGKNPYGSLLLIGSRLYGMTYRGGAYSVGLIFSIDTSGNNYKDMLDFDTANGWGPQGGLISSGSILYGMTLAGGIGVNGDGNIFRIDTDGSHFVNMFEFNGSNGKYPFGDLTLSGNMLYGMTSHGGTQDSGVIFKIDTSAIAGINNLTANKGAINIYPNPNNGTFNLIFSNINAPCNVEIYNILGEEVYTEILLQNQSNNTINLTGQPSGVYFYRVLKQDGGLVGSGKVVIEK